MVMGSVAVKAMEQEEYILLRFWYLVEASSSVIILVEILGDEMIRGGWISGRSFVESNGENLFVSSLSLSATSIKIDVTKLDVFH